MSKVTSLIVAVWLAAGTILTLAAGPEIAVDLAKDGQALQPIVVAPTAGVQAKQAATELADFLGRITGATFAVETGDGQRGLAVGPYSDFPALALADRFEVGNPFRRDDYLLRTHADGMWLVGASENGAQLAVWGFLHRLGYRLYFLTDTWEIIPSQPSLTIAVDAFEQSDYVTRQAPRGAPWSDRQLWQRWKTRNQLNASFSLNTGHAYQGIVKANQAEFDAHPEYFSLIDGKRQTTGNVKFCIGNPELRQLVVAHAVRVFTANPALDSISLDPSDGAGWCECADCAAVGSVSDRVITLANDVAEAINDLGLGPKYVGTYAYNQHSPPPSIKVHPRVVASIATSFIRGGYTIEELVEGWQAQEAVIGIRDYHDVFPWSHDLPRKARGGNLEYLQRTIPYFYANGARFMNSENMDSWGANGLGYWLTPRLLWDVDQADQLDALVEDFLANCFQTAREPMREFYTLLNRDRSARSTRDVVARLYRHLDAAYLLSDDARVRTRLDDLLLYVRYLELYYQYRDLAGAERQAAFEQVWRHAWRMRDRIMLSTYALCERDRFRDKSVKVPDEARWKVKEPDNPWKDSSPYTAAELQAILAAGIAANQPTVIDFTPVEYSLDLVPATPLKLPAVKPGNHGDAYRGKVKFYTWFSEGAQQIDLQVTGGLIPWYRDRGNVSFELHAEQEATLEAVDANATTPPDGNEYAVSLQSPYTGLHWLEWTDGSDRSRVVLPEGLPWTIRSTMDDRMRLAGSWSLYFYVPKGTRIIGGFAASTGGWVVNPVGERVYGFADLGQADYFSIPVPDGQDGALWKIDDADGARILLTVPSCFAKTADALLLPREVVKADTAR